MGLLTRDDPGVKVDIVDVTPERAEQWLARNSNNRKISSQVVAQYADAMVRGEWNIGNAAIAFDSGENLIDGQHRLQAVIRSGVTIRQMVVQGLSPDTQDTMDSGRKRSLEQQLDRHGFKFPRDLASTANFLHRIDQEKDVRHNRTKLSTPQALELIESNPGIIGSVAFAQKVKPRRMGYSVTAIAGLHYLWSREAPEDATVFFDSVISGAGLDEGDPRYVLKRALDKGVVQNRSRKQQTDTRYHAALMIKAFNAWRTGRTYERLYWTAGGSKPEPFPMWDETFVAADTSSPTTSDSPLPEPVGDVGQPA